ncbi:hypothetical protein Vi05172_g7420 [Venturia inaequalis]|nr:hypothetical protein Vi05172_g7420 [Venturia inaequalis]
MAKAKADNGVKRVQNRHCYSRIAFLHQAAQHLASKQFSLVPNSQLVNTAQNGDEKGHAVASESTQTQDKSNSTDGIHQTATLQPADGFGLSRRLASHLLTVSRKVNVRASREIKRSICKRCSSILIAGQTADHRVENKSRGGLKPCADVMVVTCSACGFEKRYPFGAQRQPRKIDRVAKSKTAIKDTSCDGDLGQG